MADSSNILRVLDELINSDKVERIAAISTLARYKERIFVEGKDVQGNTLKPYSANYLKRRVSKFNRENSSKKVLSLTGQLENDLKIVPPGIDFGCTNPVNYQKTQWLQENEKTIIFDGLTAEETKLFADTLLAELVKVLS